MKTPDVHREVNMAYVATEGLADFIHLLNTISEEEALEELRLCQTDTLNWLLNEVAIPIKEYHIAVMASDILKERKMTDT